MTCQESARLMPGYFDSELDLVHTLEIEDHLRTCATCAGALEADRALRATIARSNLRYSAPPSVVREHVVQPLQMHFRRKNPRKKAGRGIGASQLRQL